MFNFKFYREKRAELAQRMQDLLSNAEIEQRALSAEEEEEFNDCEEKIKRIDATVEAEERARKLVEEPDDKKPAEQRAENKRTPEQQEEAEIRAFCDFVRGVDSEERAENLVSAENGAIVPKSIAAKIVKRVTDICPIYSMADRYNVKGIFSIPYYDESESSINVSYATEAEDLIAGSGKFKSVELKGFLAGALAKVPKSLLNNQDFDLVNFVVNEMADSISRWISHECLVGTDGKITGFSNAKQVVIAAAETAITADELIDLQEEVPDMYQGSAVWIMNRKTRAALRKLKDKDGKYILNPDASARWGYRLLGAEVYTDENMPEMSAGKAAVIYGDMSGLAIKVTEDINIEVLRERFATQHCVGVVGWLEIDAKIENEQKIAVLKMAGVAA